VFFISIARSLAWLRISWVFSVGVMDIDIALLAARVKWRVVVWCVLLACLFVFACPKACLLLCVCEGEGDEVCVVVGGRGGPAHMMNADGTSTGTMVCKTAGNAAGRCTLFLLAQRTAGMFDKTNGIKTRFYLYINTRELAG